MDIPELSNVIIERMTNNTNNTSAVSTTNVTNYLYDYIFICFLLGNDFMPHFPAINIRTNGIDYLLNAYKEVINKPNEFLTNGNSINWKVFRQYIKFLSQHEETYLLEEYKIREKLENRKPYYNKKQTSEDLLNFFLPIKSREIEKYINPIEEILGG